MGGMFKAVLVLTVCSLGIVTSFDSFAGGLDSKNSCYLGTKVITYSSDSDYERNTLLSKEKRSFHYFKFTSNRTLLENASFKEAWNEVGSAEQSSDEVEVYDRLRAVGNSIYEQLGALSEKYEISPRLRAFVPVFSSYSGSKMVKSLTMANSGSHKTMESDQPRFVAEITEEPVYSGYSSSPISQYRCKELAASKLQQYALGDENKDRLVSIMDNEDEAAIRLLSQVDSRLVGMSKGIVKDRTVPSKASSSKDNLDQSTSFIYQCFGPCELSE